MMIMPSNSGSGLVHFMAGKYPGSVGWMVSPLSWKNPPHYMPYAIDNGAFTKWEPDMFLTILRKTVHLHAPIWIAVPDVVADAEATNRQWWKWNRRVAPFGRLAFVVQDGHEPQDVPPEAFAVFVGGSTEFKLRRGSDFKGVAPWLHIGRVNTYGRLLWAKMIGADSIDGAGFFRGDKKQLYAFIERVERRQSCFQF